MSNIESFDNGFDRLSLPPEKGMRDDLIDMMPVGMALHVVFEKHEQGLQIVGYLNWLGSDHDIAESGGRSEEETYKYLSAALPTKRKTAESKEVEG